MQIITRRSDPTHRLAFGGRDAAERFLTVHKSADNYPESIKTGAASP